MTDIINQTTPEWFGSLGETLARQREANQAAVGRALEKARKRVSLTSEEAARHLGISERKLAYLEAGIRTPSPALLRELADLYGTKIEAFGQRNLSTRIPPHIDFETETLWIGWTPIPLGGEQASNASVLRSLAHALRTMRSLETDQPVYFREREVPLISTLLDLTDDDLVLDIMEFLGLTLREADELISQMRAA